MGMENHDEVSSLMTVVPAAVPSEHIPGHDCQKRTNMTSGSTQVCENT